MIQGVPDTWEGVEAVDEISEGLPVQSATRSTSTPPPTSSRKPGSPPSDRSTSEGSDTGSNGSGQDGSSEEDGRASPVTSDAKSPAAGSRRSDSGTLTKRSVVAAPEAISGDGGSVVELPEPTPEEVGANEEVPTLVDPGAEDYREGDDAVGIGSPAIPEKGRTRKKKDKKKRKKKDKASKKASKKKKKEKKKEKKGKRKKSRDASSKAGKKQRKRKKK